MPIGQIPTEPGGLPVPWNPAPPAGGGILWPGITADYYPHPLPNDPGAGTGSPAAGDTQVTYPDTDTAPAAVTTWSFEGGQPLVIDYIEDGATPTAANEGHGLPPLKIYLGAGASGPAIPGSVRFSFRGRTYVDRGGLLYYAVDPVTNAGTMGGGYDYDSNVATLTDYASGSNTVTVISLGTRFADLSVSGVMFRTPGAPLRTGSFTLRATTVDGVQLTASSDVNGNITGTSVKGLVDWQTGLATVAFGAMVTAAGNEAEPWYDAALIDGSGNIWKPTMVDPATVFFGTVIYHAIPVDPDLIGLDPVRLPSNGLVPGFNPGGIGVLSHTQITTVASPVAGATEDLGRDRLSFVEVTDATGEAIDAVWYTTDLDAGTLTWANPLNLSAYTMPVSLRDRIQDVALIADVEITGEITFAAPVTHNYPAGAILSAAILVTDKQARVVNLFDQQTYVAGEWLDVVNGANAAGTYNDVTYPLALTNDAAIDERWAIVFTGPSTVDVIGETVGQVVTGASISADIAPINPVTITTANPTGKPYFTLDKDGWGGGWSTGNVVRFNTLSATIPVWLARVVMPGQLTQPNDAVRVQMYGNAQ